MGPSEAAHLDNLQGYGIWSVCGHITMGLPTDLILWHTLTYDKGLGVSTRPGLGQGRSCSTSQLASAELPTPRQGSYFPRSLPLPVMRVDGY